MRHASRRRDRAVIDRQAKLVLQIVLEILTVLIGLKSDEVVSEHGLHEIGMVRHRSHRPTVRPRRVQEKSDRPADLQPPHFCAERKKMIVLHPIDRVRLAEAQQSARHERVDLAIGGVVVAADLNEIRARMQRRPQGRVGEALIEAAIMFGRHVDSRERAGAERLDLREAISTGSVVGSLAARSHPDRAGILHHRDQSCGQSPGDRLIGFRPRNAVGHDDHSHGISSVPCNNGHAAHKFHSFVSFILH